LSIFFFFKPLEIKEKFFKDVPIFEFQNFTMYELDTKGLTTQMLGTKASKYQDRYEVLDINYTDYSAKYRANMLAKRGIYKEGMIDLDQNVTYTSLQKRGFSFFTQHATYDINNSLVVSDTPYVITFEYGSIYGTSLRYDTMQNKVFSKDVRAHYILK